MSLADGMDGLTPDQRRALEYVLRVVEELMQEEEEEGHGEGNADPLAA